MAWVRVVPLWAWLAVVLGLWTAVEELRIASLRGELAAEQAAFSDYRLEVAERDSRATAAAREEERRRQVAIDGVEEDGQRKLAAARVDATDARAARDRLQLEVDRLRAGRAATCGAIAAQQRQAGDRAFDLLADLFERADFRAGELAEALDRSRVAGLSCEVAYEALREVPRR